MKKILFIIVVALIAFSFNSCRTEYLAYPVSITNTIPAPVSTQSYKYLGNYYGVASETTKRGNIADDKGLVYQAKKNMIESMEKDGISMASGDVQLINIVIEQTRNSKRVTVSVSADVIRVSK